MTRISSTATARIGPHDPRARTLGSLTMGTGILFVLGALADLAGGWAWPLLLVGFALLIYVVPQVHRAQAPADGRAGRAGSRLVAAGATAVVTVSVVAVGWALVGGAAGVPDWLGVLWWLGALTVVAGIVAFSLGTIAANRLPRGAPVLMLVGVIVAAVLEWVTRAGFQEDSRAPEWGFDVGIPLFGVGLVWLGRAIRQAAGAPGAAG